MTSLEILGGASDVNNLGQVVVTVNNEHNHIHAYLWQESSELKGLGTLGGTGNFDTRSASSINDLGQVVGCSHYGAANHAFLRFLFLFKR